MGRFISQVLATMVAIILLLILVPVIFAIIGAGSAPQVPGTVVLSLDMRQPLPDKAPLNPFRSGDTPSANSVVGVVRALRRAEQDERVKGLYMRVGGLGVPVAQAQELREAIARFRQSGKFVVAHAQSIFSTGVGAYYLGAGAEEFRMQPNGQIFSSGVVTSSLFMKELFDKIGVTAQFGTYKEYKSAANGFLYDDYTDPMREARTALVNSIYDSAMGEIAADRGIGLETLKTTLDNAPIIGQAAVDAGLIDRLAYEVETREDVKARAGANAELLSLADYWDIAGPAPATGGVIALIQGDGPINEGSSDEGSAFGGDAMMGGDTIAAAIKKAADTDDVKAIILRVNSPGGSAIASEQIRHAVVQAQAKGKPVVVSMGDVAASGGYWVSMSADRIIAHPATVTGSIGVLAGKFVVNDLFKMIGVNQGEIATNDGALFFSVQREFTVSEWARLDRSLKATYDEFIEKAAAGREVAPDALERYARGRVWSGADALERDLIDATGGLRQTIDVAKEVAGIDAGAAVELRDFPQPPGLVELLDSLFSASGDVVKASRTLSEIMELPAISALTKATDLAEQEGVLAVEETEAVR